MTNVLVIHYEKSIRTILEALAKRGFHAESAKHVKAGIKQMLSRKPDVIVVGYDSKKREALQLLRYMKDQRIDTPVVVVVTRGGGAYQQQMMKKGAKGFIEYPIDQDRFNQAIESAIQAGEQEKAGPPPITVEEEQANLSDLERRLNQQMACFAGKNQVYIQSMVLGVGVSKPRICLKCPLRAEYGLNRDVYYEFIRDVCCSEPGQCEAVRKFRATRASA